MGSLTMTYTGNYIIPLYIYKWSDIVQWYINQWTEVSGVIRNTFSKSKRNHVSKEVRMTEKIFYKVRNFTLQRIV